MHFCPKVSQFQWKSCWFYSMPWVAIFYWWICLNLEKQALWREDMIIMEGGWRRCWGVMSSECSRSKIKSQLNAVLLILIFAEMYKRACVGCKINSSGEFKQNFNEPSLPINFAWLHQIQSTSEFFIFNGAPICWHQF